MSVPIYRTTEEVNALRDPKPGHQWHGPVIKILVTEVRSRLDAEPQVVFCVAHKSQEFQRAFTRTETLTKFVEFVGNDVLK